MPEINPFDPWTLLLIALFNPAVILIGFGMGRAANQWQKVPVAAFAAALGGFILFWIVSALGLVSVHAHGSAAGLVALQFLFGLGWAFLGYCFRPR